MALHRMPVVCVKCSKETRIRGMGVAVIILDGAGEPYFMAFGDVSECPDCGARIIARYGNTIERERPDFEWHVDAARRKPETLLVK